MNRVLKGVGFSAAIVLLLLAGRAQAVSVQCGADPDKNHMLIDDTQVDACLDSGEGNLTGDPANDLFLNGVGTTYTAITKSDDVDPLFDLMFTQNPEPDEETGTWSFNSSFWDSYGSAALGFKFGTGNEPDEWFVYSLQTGISFGDWEFVNVFNKGGGLSHINLYGIAKSVPEPGSLMLLGLGLLSLGLIRRRQQG